MKADQSRSSIATLACGVIVFVTAFFVVRGISGVPEIPEERTDPNVEVQREESSQTPVLQGDVEVTEIITSHGLVQMGSAGLTPEERDRLRFGEWAKRDPQRALEAAAAWDEENGIEIYEEHSMTGSVVIAIAEHDPDLAVEICSSDDSLKFWFLSEVFAVWPTERLGEAVEILTQMLDESEPGYGEVDGTLQAVNRVAARWPEGDSESLLRWLAESYAHQFPGERGEVIELIGERDLHNVEFIRSLSSGTAQLYAAKVIVSRDVELGLQAVDYFDQTDPQNHERTASLICYAAGVLAGSDPQGALRLLDERFDQIFNESQLYLPYWNELDPIGDQVRAGTISEEEIRQLPVPLQRALGLQIPTAEQIQWDAGRDGENNPAVLETLFRQTENWAREDSLAASAWLVEMEPGANRDHAISGLVRAISTEEPQSAVDWANAIGDPELRERFMRVALRAWKPTDPEAAAEVIQNSDLSEMAVESLLRP